MKVNRIFLILFLSLMLLLFWNSDIYAANANVTVTPETVEVGKPVTITVSGNGVQWNLKLKVDGEVLKTNSEFENYESNKDISFSVSYTPTTVGTKNVTLEGSVTEFSDGSTVKTFSPKSITVKEKEQPPVEQEKPTTPSTPSTPTTPEKPAEQPKEKSNNAYLSTLGITPKEYDFSGFKKTKMEYSITIPYDIDSVRVLYKTADSKAKVQVTGNSGFEVGSNNKITVKVTAEDGKTTQTYTIKVTKLAEEEEKPGNVIDDKEEGLYLNYLSIDGVELSPEFEKDKYSYTATLSKGNITEVTVNAIANKSDAIIEITGNTNLVVGENTINIVVKQKDSAVQTVYQIALTKEEVIQETPATDSKDTNIMGNIISNMKNYFVIAIGVIVLMIVAVIILVILLIKENKRIKNKRALEENNKEYDVYENDESEFEKQETEEVEEKTVENISNETETKDEVKRSRRREKGKHSK